MYILSRDAGRAKKAIEELEVLTGKSAEFIEVDLGDLGSIRRAVGEFNR